MVIFLPAALAGDLVSWGGVALALLWGTGLWGFGYRWLFYWRRHPQLFAEVRQEVSNDGVLDEQAGVHQRFPWSHWNTLLYTRDGLMLMTARSGNVNFLLVPRRGLLADQEWAELVALVQKQVQQHPRASLGAVSAL